MKEIGLNVNEQPEVVIVGGGPAGLSAALLLGRCRRRTLVIDSGHPRNAASHALHGYLTRDGIEPGDFLRHAKQDLASYETVRLLQDTVIDVQREEDGFVVDTEQTGSFRCRMLLLATGVVDPLPEIPGVAHFYGRGVFHCPYCDGWEHRDRRLVAYGRDAHGLALELKQWSSDVTFVPGEGGAVSERVRARLAATHIPIADGRVVRLDGHEGSLTHLCFDTGRALPCDALFFKTAAKQHSPLAETLGCEMTEDGLVKTGKFEITRVPGLFVAGDATRNVHLAVVAAAEGAQAAFAINTALMKADLPHASDAAHGGTDSA